MEASKSKWVYPVLDNIGVNSLRLGGIQIKMLRLLSPRQETFSAQMGFESTDDFVIARCFTLQIFDIN